MNSYVYRSFLAMGGAAAPAKGYALPSPPPHPPPSFLPLPLAPSPAPPPGPAPPTSGAPPSTCYPAFLSLRRGADPGVRRSGKKEEKEEEK